MTALNTIMPYLGEAQCPYCGKAWVVFSPSGFNEKWKLECTGCGKVEGRIVS